MRMGGPVGLGGGGIGTIVIVLLDLVAHWREPAVAAPDDRRAFRGAAESSVPTGTGQRPAGQVHRRRARRHGGHLDRDLREGGRALSAAGAGAVQRRRAVGLRLGLIGDGAVLLSRATSKVYLDLVVLPRARPELRRARRLRAGLRRRARGRPSRPERARHQRAGRAAAAAGVARPRPTASRCGWSCRPTATPASGATHAARQDMLEQGDVDEGLRAAAAIGDDRLQRQCQGRVVAGELHPRLVGAARRVAAPGLSSGPIEQCDTFRPTRANTGSGAERPRRLSAPVASYQIFARCSGARYSLSPP